MGFSRQEYWSGLPCPPLGDPPDPGMNLPSSILQGILLTKGWNLPSSRGSSRPRDGPALLQGILPTQGRTCRDPPALASLLLHHLGSPTDVHWYRRIKGFSQKVPSCCDKWATFSNSSSCPNSPLRQLFFFSLSQVGQTHL